MWQTLPPTIAGLRLKVLEDNLKSNILNIPQLNDDTKWHETQVYQQEMHILDLI